MCRRRFGWYFLDSGVVFPLSGWAINGSPTLIDLNHAVYLYLYLLTRTGPLQDIYPRESERISLAQPAGPQRCSHFDTVAI